MRLGIDFGTTHTVAALVDRGNYPVVSYEWGDAVPSLVAYLERLRDDIVNRSNAGVGRNETLEVAVSVPANASNDQRFLTLEAFRRAGFEVLALLNEPYAAGFEYAHRFRSTVTSRREYVLVYDLGGGTFDSSLIHMAGHINEVITTAGVARLGGDDLDEAILEAVLDSVG